MTKLLNLLIIEDSEADYLLVTRNLEQHGVEAHFHRVDSMPDLLSALEAGTWDAILSDYSLPGMEFRTNLALIRAKLPDLPLILVSGSIGEEEALNLLRSGLTDFVLKDRPTRLAGALRHSLDASQALRATRITEAALRESEARFSTMFRLSPMAIGVSRASDGRLVEVNDALLELFGHSREEAIGLTTTELGFFIHSEDRDRLMDEVRQRGRARNFQFQGRRKNGEICDLLLSMERIQIGGEAFFLGMCSDITAMMTAERSLLEREQQYRSLFMNMAEGVAHCRLIVEDGFAVDWEYLAVNPAYARITGLDGVEGRRVSEVMPQLRVQHPELFLRLHQVVSSGVPAKYEVYLTPIERWLSVSAYRPAPGECVVVLDNISERKLAESGLQASQARFQAVFNASPVGIVLSQPDTGMIIDANPAFLNFIGYQRDQVVGRSSVELGLWVDPEDRKNAVQQLRDTGSVRHMNAPLRHLAGGVLTVSWSTEQVEVGGEPVLVNLIQDETARQKAEDERRRLEAEVAHAQKLESLGALAGGVSHDMNNVLGAILSLSSMLREKHKDDPSLAKSMDILLHAATRGRDLVKGLTDFARKDVNEPKALNLNEVARKEAALLTRTTLQKIQIDLDLQKDLPEVIGDESSLSNALMNLSVNAMDAMPTGGRLCIRTRTGPQGEVSLSVVDSGSGMTPDVLERAMEPFFTTKAVGKGTGLGLALVYGVMKAHGGDVAIESEVGKGTTIILRFPKHITAGASVTVAQGREETASRRFRILLVDDDDLIRCTVPDMLEALGHEVVAVSGGLEALQRVQSGLVPELVILDLSMPGMDGEETLARLRLLCPELPILISTGYKDERHARIVERFTDVTVITKPFTMMELKLRLAQLD